MPMPLSSDKLHLTMTKSSTFSGLRDALLAVTTFPAAENTLSDFELAAGTGKTILTRCERSVKYTLQLSWFTLPKTRPEPDPEPGLLTITRPEPDPKSKSATRQALLLCNGFVECPVRLEKTHQIQLQRWCRSARSTSANMDTMFASDVAGILSYRAVLNAGYKCSHQTFCDIMLPLLSKSSTCSGFVPYITVRT